MAYIREYTVIPPICCVCSYMLNTCVDLPHEQPVTALAFRPPLSGNDNPMAVTASSDGRFKLWTLADDTDIYRKIYLMYCQTSNIRCTLVGDQIVDSDVAGASPVGAAPTTSSFSTWTPGLMDWGEDNCKTRWETFKFLDLMWGWE